MTDVEVSLYIGGIKPLPDSGRSTGMYKLPLRHPADLTEEGFSGDQQADRRVHGGIEKAVHLYPTRHYDRLAEQFPAIKTLLMAGCLGENIATDALDENDVRIGEIWQLGAARLQVCQPRNPCWKIDQRLGCEGVAAFIDEQMLCGWYWRVLAPATVRPGDRLQLESTPPEAPTLRYAMTLWREHRPDMAELERVAATPGIATGWQSKIRQRLAWLKKA